MFQCLLTRETFVFLRNSFFRNFSISFFPSELKRKKASFCLLSCGRSAKCQYAFPFSPLPFSSQKRRSKGKSALDRKERKRKRKRKKGGWVGESGVCGWKGCGDKKIVKGASFSSAFLPLSFFNPPPFPLLKIAVFWVGTESPPLHPRFCST